MNAQLTFQGLTATTRQLGTFPWFAPILGWLDDKQDRRDCMKLHKDAGDGLVNLAVSSKYDKYAYAGMPGKDFYRDGLGILADRIKEALDFGFVGVKLMLAGDGHGDGVNYNDPVGWTYGYEWLMAHFEAIHDALGKFDPWIQYYPGYDGVVPGWATQAKYTYPDEVDKWLLKARAIGGNGIVLGVELATGYAHWGGEGGNYDSEAGLALDIVSQEFPAPIGPPDPLPKPWAQMSNEERNPWSQVWSMVGRLQRPYTPSQVQIDSGFDLNPIYYLRTPTSRGPRKYEMLEFDTYEWGQNRITVERVQQHRQALRDMGGPTATIG